LTKKSYRNNIFDLLARLDRGEEDFWHLMSDEEQKDFQPWLIQRWLSSQKLELVNEITNPLIGNMDKEMVWKLFCAIGIPGTRKYKFPKAPRSSSYKNDPIIGILAAEYRCSRRTAKEYRVLHTDEEIIEMAEGQGMDKDEVKKIKKRL
jgi:hypothetical protein